jgi:DNA-directed RNA polymerase subunit beta'
MRAVHPSQLGFVDPIHTPESEKIGAITQFALLTSKKGNELTTAMVDPKTGKVKKITPIEASQSVISFADQFEKVGKAYRPKYKKVKASVRNRIQEIDPNKVDYILVSDKQIFSIPSNMTPFVNHISGNRSMMSGKHMEQALPLKHREAPLVQNKMTTTETFEKHMGSKSNTFSKVSGTIKKITKSYIDIDDGTKVVRHNIYNKFINPIHKVYLHQQPVIQIGDKVKENQLIAESNYSKNGVYSTGINLRTAFMPYKGYTFEDGIVISEEAAKKLTSLHMYKEKISTDPNSILDKSKYLSFFPTKINSTNFAKLDDRGIIKINLKVTQGDTLIAHLHKEDYTKEDVLMAQFNRKFLKPYKDRSLIWDKEYEGTIRKIIERPREIEVQVETEEPARSGDKIAGRAGNKGIITHVIPQNEVPTTSEGKPIDLFMNPHAIVGRINPAQLLEAAAGKVAEKREKPYIVDNFGVDNYNQKVERELRNEGLKSKEYIKDPDGTVIDKPVAVGNVHILKLNHPVRGKFQVRETGTYTADMQPTSGGGKGASKMDQLTIYGMLSHGSTKNLQEAMTIKSEKNDDFWHAYQAGLPVPKPKIPFVFDKFKNSLMASGINMERHGDELQLSPITDKDIKDISNGEINEPEFIQGKNLREIKGGLFDPVITGGTDGNKWGYINLVENIPNPVFENAIKSVLGLKGPEYEDIVQGTTYVDKNGIINVDKRGATGGEAIRILLSKINVKEQLDKNIKLAKNIKPGTQLDAINRKIRYLKALQETKNDPTIFINKKIGVIPPKFRPITPMEGGRLNISDANTLYKDLMLINNQLKKQKQNKFPDEQLKNLRKNLYNSYGALVGVERALTDNPSKEQAGFLQQIAGKKPKEGFFQDRMLSKRQDYSARSTVIPEPYYNIDDVGLPEEMLWSLYKPFVVRRLQQLGYKPNKAIDEVKNRTDVARGILEQEVQVRPVLLNRAPSLHKFSVMAFNPKSTIGKAIKMNPLVVEGFNMDFDGDAAGVHVPISDTAVQEARRMLPSQNLFNPRDNSLIHKPSKEQVTGLFMMTTPGKKITKKYTNVYEVVKDFKDGELKINDVVDIKGPIIVGSILVNSVLPVKYRDSNKIMDKTQLNTVLDKISKEDPALYGSVISKLKDLGNDAVYKLGLTTGLDDLKINYSERNKLVNEAKKELESKGAVGVAPFVQRIKDFTSKDLISKKSDFAVMIASGAKGKEDAVTQMVSTPFLTTDNNNKIIPFVIEKSYSEGLSAPEYFSTLGGARKGMIDRALSTSEPGQFTKEMINSVIGSKIVEFDCETQQGIEVDTKDKNNALGRYTVDGQLIDNQFLNNYNKKTIKVRSPLTCEAKNSPCAKCFGIFENGKLPEIGTYIGTIAGQAMTEPSTQMLMRKFHTGGSVLANISQDTGSDDYFEGFKRVEQILELPQKIKGKAELATINGTVTSVVIAPQGGWNVIIAGKEHYVPGTLQMVVKVGDKVKAGDRISTGTIKPQELSEFTNPLTAKLHMVNEIDKEYREEGRKINNPLIETVVNSFTNKSQIIDPGKSEYVPGDYLNTNKLNMLNKEGKDIKAVPVFQGINSAPLKDDDFLARLNFQELKKTLREGAAQNWKSSLIGTNPIPGLVYGAEFGAGDLR